MIFACIFASASLYIYIYLIIFILYLIISYLNLSHLMLSYLILSDLILSYLICILPCPIYQFFALGSAQQTPVRPRFQGQRFGDQGAKGWDNEKIHKWFMENPTIKVPLFHHISEGSEV